MISLLLALAAYAATEEEVFSAWEEGSFLTAGRLASELLAEDPASMVGNFVRGYVLWKEEGEHARAQHFLDKAEAEYQRRKDLQLLPEEGWRMHLRIMDAQLDILSELGRPEEQLALMEVYNQDFTPGVNVERAWPTMRLQRYDEAREIALAHVDDEGWRRGAALNSMCAIEAEAHQRVAAYEWCMRALEHERGLLSPDPTVDAGNASSAALGILDFEASLALAREATGGSARAVTNPYRALVAHHTRAGNGAAALEAVQGVVAWRQRQPPSMRDLARSASEETLAAFLYAAGRPARARELIDRAIQFPDRAGLTSAEPMQAEGRQAAVRLLIRRLEAEQAREEAALEGFPVRTTQWLSSWLPDPGVWEDRATLRTSLMDTRRQRATFRIYLDGGLGLAPHMLALLGEDIGQGVYLTAVDTAAHTEALLPTTGAPTLAALPHYYDALRLGAASARGDWDEVEHLAERTWTGLPTAEALLRAQVAASAGEAIWGRGDLQTATAWFGRALEVDPGSLRRLGIALPASVSAVEGPIADSVATLLRRSPRLSITDGAFQVVVSGNGDSLSICLRDRFGAQLSCSTAPPLPAGPGGETPSDWERAQHHVRTWTQHTFALPTGRAAVDLDSLDGTTLRRRDVERSLLDELIGEL